MILENWIEKHVKWSQATFGTGCDDNGIIDHIEKELVEITRSPGDLEEWIDVIILAIDGASRNGFSPAEIGVCLEMKRIKNANREWNPVVPGRATEHVRTGGGL